MLVSVIIPTYNHQNYILGTLISVFEQTLKDYEIIVINDGSPDKTANILAPLIQEKRIRYIEQDNAGVASARNTGIAEAKGEFLAFLDDDDIWPPDKLEWQLTALKNNPNAVLVYGYYQFMENHPTFKFPPETDAPSGIVKSRFLRRNWMRSPGQTMIRKNVIKDIGGFDTQLWGVDDWDIYIRLADKGEFIYNHRLALFYRKHAMSASQNFARMFTNLNNLHKKHLGAFPSIQNWGIWWESKHFISNIYFNDCIELAYLSALNGDRAKALQLWLLAARMHPLLLGKRNSLRSLLFLMNSKLATKLLDYKRCLLS